MKALKDSYRAENERMQRNYEMFGRAYDIHKYTRWERFQEWVADWRERVGAAWAALKGERYE